MASYCRRRPWNRLQDWICSCRCGGGRCRTDLPRFEELSDSISVMTHKMDPTVKIWPGYGRDEEPTEKAILFDKEIARTPLPGAPTVDRLSSAVLRGVFHEGRLIGRGARDQEQEGNRNTRVRHVEAVSMT